MQKSKIITGLQCDLRPIRIEDTSNIVAWRNAPHVRKNLYSQNLINENDHITWLNNKVFTGQCAQYIIIDKGTNVAAGTAFLKNIDNICKKAEFGIFIGEIKLQGRGLGKEATNILLKYGFEELALNKIYLTVFSDNEKAVKLYENMGFLITGLFEEDCFVNNRLQDVFYMELLSKNYFKDL